MWQVLKEKYKGADGQAGEEQEFGVGSDVAVLKWLGARVAHVREL